MGLSLAVALGLWIPAASSGQAVFQLGNATARPGQTVSVPLTIAADARGVMGWHAVVQYHPAAVAVAAIESVRPADVFQWEPNSHFTETGMVYAAAVYSLWNDGTRAVLPGQNVTVANVDFCVLATAAEGTYTIGFAPQVAGRPQWGPPSAVTGYFPPLAEDSSLLTPVIQPGSIRVSGTPVASSACQGDVAYTPPPSTPVVSFALAAPALVARGAQFPIDWNITTNSPLASYTAAIDYDESVLAFLSGTLIPDWFSDWSFQWVSAEDGNLAVAAVTDFAVRSTLPPGQSQTVARFQFEVSPATQAASTRIVFVRFVERTSILFDGSEARSWTYNTASPVTGELESPDDLTPTEIEVEAAGRGAFVAIGHIIGEVTTFIRGDANQNDRVELADATFVLNYLFRGGSTPVCLDAADANDDGELNITDPVVILRYLFAGTAELPDPGPSTPGPDPTPDTLPCGE